MKICYLTYDIDIKAGWGRFAHDLISGVKKDGHETLILKEKDDGLEGVPILKRGMGVFLSALKIRKYLKDYDIIHALDGYPYGVIADIANRKLKKKLVITAMGTYAVAPLYNWKTSNLLQRAYRKANKVISVSAYTKNEILKKVMLKNIEIVSNGVDFNKFYREHLDSKEKFILSVGAIKDRKGYHVSISAFAKMSKELPGFKYFIVGKKDKEYFNYIQEIIRKEGVGDRVVFFEGISDEKLSELYQKARLFILTPINASGHHFEGFGLVYLEAASAGLPVIGTYNTGAEEAVANNRNGLLVSQNDSQETAKAMRKILEDGNLWQKMSQESYKWAEEHDIDLMVKKYLDIYNNL